MTETKYLTDYLGLNAMKVGAKPALVCDDITLSWSELAHRVDQAAANLSRELNAAEQQVVGLLFSNGWQFVVAYLAILQTGHIALPLDPTYKELELDAIVKQVKPVVVITNGVYKTKIDYKRILLIDDLLSGTAGRFKRLRTSPKKQIASLTFTSGTTGKPKVVPNTHANHTWNIKVCSEAWDWTSKDTLLLSTPLSHMLGLVMGLSGILYHGNTLYLHEWFDPQETLKVLASGKISFFTHFPLAYAEMLDVDEHKQYDLSNVRVMVSGGAPLPPQLSQQFSQRYGSLILETYGTTESGRIAANIASDHTPGSAGLILPEVKIKISDAGEVLIKSPGVFPGYFNNPEATAHSLDNAGWWHTGDIGELKAGRLFLKGRTQERIRRFGYSLSPRDIEWALHQFPKIKDVYVMGVQHPDQPNDELVYFIDGQASTEQIRDYCKINLPYAWRPDRIVLLDAIPKTRSGKTRLTALNKTLLEHTAAGDGH